jgi:tetratricopeptide (TPR) repeat protein
LLTQLGGFAFYSGRYDEAERLLHEARARTLLTPQPGSQRLTSATLDWLQALLYRWRNQPALALDPAQAAADVYIEAGSPASAARIQTVLADIELDLAKRLPEGTARAQHIARARGHLHLATRLATEAYDEHGQEMAHLRAIRLAQVAQPGQSQQRRIERVVRVARRLRDDLVLADALTLLGDDLSAQGQIEPAINQYRQVIGLLDGGQAPAVAVWARRALHKHLEQHP